MKSIKEEFIDSLLNGGMMDNIYGYVYRRCFSKSEAEELCQEIITEILFALTNDGYVANLTAYVWRIANNTFINHINKNKRIQNQSYSFDDMPSTVNAIYNMNMEDDIINRIVDSERLDMIKREIASLAEIYRDVMVMYYFDELPMLEISKRLNIPMNRVKQRLFTAKNKIRKEVLSMSTDKSEQAVKLYDLQLAWWGGDLFRHDTRNKISSSLLRKNIIISCRSKAKTVQELSDEFNVSLAIMKDEIGQIPEDFLKKVSGGKYIANSIVIDIELQSKIEKLTADIAKDYFKDVKKYLLSKKDDIMSLPYINPPKSFEYLLWWYLPQFADAIKSRIHKKLEDTLANEGIKKQERKAIICCSILDPDDKEYLYKGKNHNGIWNVFNMLGQHEEVRINNLQFPKYLTWDRGRFWAGQNFNSFPELAMIFKTINGLDVNSVDENDKEATAKALEKGYIRKENGKLYPDVAIAPDTTERQLIWYKWGSDGDGANSGNLNELAAIAEKYADKVISELLNAAKEYLPKHLLDLLGTFIQSTLHLEYFLMEEGVKDGILYELPETGCTEGIFAFVYRASLAVDFEKVKLVDGYYAEYKIATVRKNGLGEKIGLEHGDIMLAVNGLEWLAYLKDDNLNAYNKGCWKDGDIITVDRNGKRIDISVKF